MTRLVPPPILRSCTHWMNSELDQNGHFQVTTHRGDEMRDDLSGVISLSDRVTAQHNHKTTWNTLTTTKSTSPSYLVHLEKSKLPDCMCLVSDLFPQTRTCSVLDPTLELGFQLLTRLQTAQLTEAQGIPRILSSRIVTRSIKRSLTFVRHLGAHRKPSAISLPAFERNLFGVPEVFNEKPPAPDASS